MMSIYQFFKILFFSYSLMTIKLDRLTLCHQHTPLIPQLSFLLPLPLNLVLHCHNIAADILVLSELFRVISDGGFAGTKFVFQSSNLFLEDENPVGLLFLRQVDGGSMGVARVESCGLSRVGLDGGL